MFQMASFSQKRHLLVRKGNIELFLLVGKGGGDVRGARGGLGGGQCGVKTMSGGAIASKAELRCH